MKIIPVEELVSITKFWVSKNWPLNKEESKLACRELGWVEWGEGEFKTPYNLKDGYAFITVSPVSQELCLIDFSLSDAFRHDSIEETAASNDIFVQQTSAFKATWGKPKMSREKNFNRATWFNLESGCRIDLIKGKFALFCHIYSPGYAEVERYLGERML